ncbi:MAG: tryptophan 2,3-dioxygenase [Cytophagales bacterium]|nr:MAG: tryptophan 2,3-dioxygenase [Cytophagales bacterium]
MDNLSENTALLQRIKALEEKYKLTGQNLLDNLEGLLHQDYLKYWDYVHLDTLLSLQNPKTDFPDEMIFITYHQITELYFKLILWEISQIANRENLDVVFFQQRLQRIVSYLEHLCHSFDIMVEGMEFEQFRQFRMALLPASGFQSAQFRKIEICATDFGHLLTPSAQGEYDNNIKIETVWEDIYWRSGSIDEKTGKITITAQHFQEKYKEDFIYLAEEYKQKNLWQCYLKADPQQKNNDLREILRQIDYLMNVEWRLAHFKSAVRYLKAGNKAIEATGGTNWQKYLPPRFQRTIFYPALWTEEEKEQWGKNWVEQQ